MKIIDRLKEKRVNISFEIFPPKTDTGYEGVVNAAKEMANASPAFISVTYGASGGTSANTTQIAAYVKQELGIESLAHLTCASSTKEEVLQVIASLKKANIENVLALRGDKPAENHFPKDNQYQYASDLVKLLKQEGDFCIGAACYPEGHVENEHKVDDLKYLKHKVDCGVDFLTTQMFFDNAVLYNFLYRIREAGIYTPVVAGIMPVTNGKQIKRICELSGAILPMRFKAIVDCFGDTPKAMMQAGIAYATDQIIDLLANGVTNIHVYSMNKPEVALGIMNNLSEIVGQ
jgi:5,10-methylenetetrahydrofolate reductase, prokaryotic form